MTFCTPVLTDPPNDVILRVVHKRWHRLRLSHHVTRDPFVVRLAINKEMSCSAAIVVMSGHVLGSAPIVVPPRPARRLRRAIPHHCVGGAKGRNHPAAGAPAATTPHPVALPIAAQLATMIRAAVAAARGGARRMRASRAAQAIACLVAPATAWCGVATLAAAMLAATNSTTMARMTAH